MIIVKICCGLGNQMFQYGLNYSLKEKGKEVKLDIRELGDYLGEHGWNNIFDVFGLPVDSASENEIEFLSDNQNNFLNRLRCRIFGRKETHIIENKDGDFDPDILEMDNVYLEGFWQSDKYFNCIKNKICGIFSFNNQVSVCTKEVLHKIINTTNSVSIHVRRGDYLKGRNVRVYGGICDDVYYENALSHMRNVLEKPVFFCFSFDSVYK